MPIRRTIPVTVAALLICSPPANAIEKGDFLGAALHELRRAGLQLLFSSSLIRPELRVEVEPGSGDPVDVARRILAPHGLALQSVKPGLYSVVRSDTATNASRSERTLAQPPSAQEEEPLYEVGVYASRYVIDQSVPSESLAELSRAELEALPGLNEDVMRATRFLPGTAGTPLSARTHVRGGRDDELAVYFDGVPLFEPFHYKDVQGLLGLLDPESVSRVDFFSGVFPARYGNRLSGVLDIAPRIGTDDDYHAIGASVLYTHAISQGRLDTAPVEWLASIRRGNLDAIADIVNSDNQTEPDFVDALARLQTRLGERHTLTAGWLLLDDSLRANFRDGTESGHFQYRDATGWASWQFDPTDRAELRTTVSRTERHTDREGSIARANVASGTLTDARTFDTTTARLEGSAKVSRAWSINAGLEWHDYHARYGYASSATFNPLLAPAFNRPSTIATDLALDVDGEAYGAFASAALEITPRLALDAALRWDAQRFGGFFNDNQLSPRFSVQYRLDPATLVRLSWGHMAQTQRPDELQVSDGEASFHDAQRSTQTVLGVERRLGDIGLLRIEAYNRRVSNPAPDYENLLDPLALLPELEIDRVAVHPDNSRIYGIELSARWRWTEAWSGWTSYSWSEATDHFGSTSVLRSWDQKHSVATGIAWMRAPWQLSANLDWHSGWRRNALVATPAGFELEPRNSDAWSFFLSLDLRASWLHALRSGVLEVFAEIDNATDHTNPCCVSYELATTAGVAGLESDTSTWLPRTYLIGVTWQLP